jgi:hypothetical protein
MNPLRTDCGTAASTRTSCSIAGLRRGAGFATFSLACLLALLVLGSLQGIRESPMARWQDRLYEAEAAMRRGDIYSAHSLYSQTARIASWNDHWTGVLAAACGLQKLERPRGGYFVTRTMLVRAMIAAENQKSVPGLSAVADAFASIGEHKAAAMVRNRIPSDVPIQAAETLPPSVNCW